MAIGITGPKSGLSKILNISAAILALLIPVTGGLITLASAHTNVKGEESPTISVTLNGAGSMTDRSPADITAVVRNNSTAETAVTVKADASHHQVIAAQKVRDLKASKIRALQLTLPPRSARLLFIEVRAKDPVRQGTAALVVIATTKTQPPEETVAVQELQVELAGSDLLPGALGFPALIVPGLVAVWAALEIWVADRRRLGLRNLSSPAIIWGNKLWLLAAVAVSLISTWSYSAVFGQVDLLDTYRWHDLALVTVGAAAFTAVAALTVVGIHRWHTPLITQRTSVLNILRAVQKRGSETFEQPVYQISENPACYGLLVHHDREATVLTPPIKFSKPDTLFKIYNKTDRNLTDAINEINKIEESGGIFDAKKNTSDLPETWISDVTVALSPKRADLNDVEILRFRLDSEEGFEE
ncbi:hypothetical protein KBZ10_25355 [Streptomyces sp. F63]|uniref:hypothetical protein n=1 Tax=Streptomyces sp. F63 TaxID=2824887 RepID=UPI001B3621CC|nr:hypothetical protein [Streptomyces sp. F63]MBQ0987786.1 hypothetical protein [Streptomyces sp. F63]